LLKWKVKKKTMIKTFNITKKLAITFATKLTRFGDFTLITINTNNFFNYNFNIVICNFMFTITYENTKQQEYLARWNETFLRTRR
jgi:hypothetical protein